MKENEIRLIKDLYNHYDQNQEVNGEFLKSLTENYGTIRGILMNVILKYDPEAEITDEYLDAKLKQYNIDLKSTIQENDANESKEDDVVSSEIIGETQENPKPVASASKKTKRKWVLSVVIASILIISGAVFFILTSKNSVTQEKTVDEIDNEWEKEWIERNKIADRDNSYEEEQIKGLLLAEDDRNFNEIIKYYDLKNIKRYWNYNNPTYDLLKTLYLKSWSNTGNSSNNIKNINKVEDKTYDVNLDFSYLDRKDNSYKVVNSNVRFVFNEYGKIIEVYGVDDSNVEQKHGVVVSDKAYFYLTPNFSSSRNGYLIKGDKFTYTNSVNGFANASFTNLEGVTTNGWILESAFLEGESTNMNALNEKENRQIIKELGTSYFRIKINNNVKNLNIRNYPINGDVITKISGGEIYTVTKVFEASEPIYLLKYEMSFKDIETGEEIKKPADYKLSNLREIGDDIFYAEVFNTNNTINKITLKRNSFKIENNNWLYLKELNGWMYSKFGSKISQNDKNVDKRDFNKKTDTKVSNEELNVTKSNLETKIENLENLKTKAEEENKKLKDRLKKQQTINSLEPWYSSEKRSSGEYLKQIKKTKEELINSYQIDLKEIIIYRIPGNDNTKESFTAYRFGNLKDFKFFKEKTSEDTSVELYFESPEKFTLYYVN